MAIKNLRGLLSAIAMEQHYAALIGDPRFDNAFDEHHRIGDELHATDGVAYLKLRYTADGDSCTFPEWLSKKRAAMILDGGIAETAADAMPVAEFAAKIAGKPVDLIEQADVMTIAGKKLKTVQNELSKWRKRQAVDFPVSYAAIRPLLLESWPDRASVISENFTEVRAFLDASR